MYNPRTVENLLEGCGLIFQLAKLTVLKNRGASVTAKINANPSSLCDQLCHRFVGVVRALASMSCVPGARG